MSQLVSCSKHIPVINHLKSLNFKSYSRIRIFTSEPQEPSTEYEYTVRSVRVRLIKVCAAKIVLTVE